MKENYYVVTAPDNGYSLLRKVNNDMEYLHQDAWVIINELSIELYGDGMTKKEADEFILRHSVMRELVLD